MKYSEEEKAEWLKAWQKSGKSAWAYAKENGLIPQTFERWANGKTKKKNSFVQIRSKVITVNQAVIIVEKGDIKIHIPLGTSSSELRTAIECLGVSL